MISFALLVPIVAAGSLTAAFLMPIRDERRGERATVHGLAPLRAFFLPRVSTIDLSERQELARKNASIVRVNAFLMRTKATLGRLWQPATSSRGPAEVADVSGGVDRTPVTFEEHVEALLPSEPGPRIETSEPFGERETMPNATVPPDRTAEPTHVAATRGWERDAGSGRDPVPPLTRTRLRPVRSGITWPARLRVAHVGLSDGARRELLLSLGRATDNADEDALRTAFYEEDAAGRLLALRALAHVDTAPVRRLFRDTMIRGSEDERSLAVDVLAQRGEHEALHVALADRVDAIAARAALAIVASHRRIDYEAQLAGHVDAPRLERLLALLVAVVR